MNEPILRLRGIEQVYRTRKPSGWGWTATRAADGVDLDVHEGETLAVVGESGSGKSTLAKLMLALATPTSGEITFRGTGLDQLSGDARRRYRREIQAVFQDPASSLNPRMRVRRTLSFIVRRHGLVQPEKEEAFLCEQLRAVDLTPPEEYLARYPHQLSGGQQQRVAIARALLLHPKLIVADEPISSLDVSVQAQVLDLLRELKQTKRIGYVVISHDLGAMQSIADRTAVMYRGRIVELGPTIYARAFHPYTRMLLDARLSLDPTRSRIRAGEGQPASAMPVSGEGGCRFRGRCAFAIERCAAEVPPLRPVGPPDTFAACHRAEEVGGGTAR